MQAFGINIFKQTASKFFLSPTELVSKFNVGSKSLLQQGLSEQEFHLLKCTKIISTPDFDEHIRKVIMRYTRIGFNFNVIRQSECLVFNPVTGNNLIAHRWIGCQTQ